MTTTTVDENHRSSVSEMEEEDVLQESIKKGQIILNYIESIDREESSNTSIEEKREKGSISRILTRFDDFYGQVIIPLQLLQFSEQREREEEEKLEFLHDYVVDELSVEYHSAKKFHEHLVALRKRYGIDKSSSQ